MDTKVVRNALGYYELEHKPTQEELKAYYADKYYQEACGSYESSYSEEEKGYFRNKTEQKYLLAKKHLKLDSKRQPRYLDVGAGEGWSLAFFYEMGWDCLGLDYSKYGCSKQNPNVSVFLRDGDVYENLHELISEGKKFDFVLLDNVLEHVLDPMGLLVAIRSILFPGGVLIVEVPNDFSVLHEYLLKRGYVTEPFWVAAPDHVSYFGPEGLANLANASGWRQVDLASDFPIDLFLLNERTNYVMHRETGKSCHKVRVEAENLMHSISPEKTVSLYRALAQLGFGRVLTAVLCLKN